MYTDPTWRRHQEKRYGKGNIYHIVCPPCLKDKITARHTYNHWAFCPRFRATLTEVQLTQVMRLQALFTFYKQDTADISTWTDLLHAHYIYILAVEVSEFAAGIIVDNSEWNNFLKDRENMLKAYGITEEEFHNIRTILTEQTKILNAQRPYARYLTDNHRRLTSINYLDNAEDLIEQLVYNKQLVEAADKSGLSSLLPGRTENWRKAMELINKTNTLGSLRKNMTALELARNYIRHNDS